MTDEEFNKLLSGPLHHPIPMFTVTRLMIALKTVVDATGVAGAQALREHCRNREESDEAGDEDFADQLQEFQAQRRGPKSQ